MDLHGSEGGERRKREHSSPSIFPSIVASSSSSESGASSTSHSDSPHSPRRNEHGGLEQTRNRKEGKDLAGELGQPRRRSVFDRLDARKGEGGDPDNDEGQDKRHRGSQRLECERPHRLRGDAARSSREDSGGRESARYHGDRQEHGRREFLGSRREDEGHDRYRRGPDGGDHDRWRGVSDGQEGDFADDRFYRRQQDTNTRRVNDRARERDRESQREGDSERDRDWYQAGKRSRERERRDTDRSPRKRRRDDGDRAQGPRPGLQEPPQAEIAADTDKAHNGKAATGGGAEVMAEMAVRKSTAFGKTGGVYIPPFKLARMLANQGAQDKSSPEYQRLTWEALKKSLNGIINKVNVVNVKNILPEVFKENLLRGRGLLCRSLMKSQAASPSFTPVYSALVAVINTKFPEIGELLLSRLILQFKRSFKRNDKPVCTAAAKFIAHLVNQGIAHEVLALEVLILLLEQPSEDSVEMAVEFVKEVGAHLQEVAPQGLHGVFERFRAILHEGAISKRVQFIIEGLFALRKAGFEASGFPALKPELDLVEAEDQLTHELGLDDNLQAQTTLDVFRVDPDFEEGERKYAVIAREILGEEEKEDAQEGGIAGTGSSEPAEEESSDDEEGAPHGVDGGAGRGGILDETATNLVNLRRTIYLTLMSSFDFEEAGHKLLKIGIQPGQEIELVTMIIECCSQERTFKRFYGLLAQRFCYLSRAYAETFEDCFRKQYSVIHRLETNKLRNVSCLFAHLLATDALPWSALTAVRLTEEDTTSSSRIFIKYLFQELSSTMGLAKLNQRLNDPAFSSLFEGLFPRNSLQHMRFSINFFTSIGLGGVTDAMREHYKQAVAAQAAVQQQAARRMLGDGSSSSSDDSSTSSSSESESSSSSESDNGSDDDRWRRQSNRKRSSKKKGRGGSE